MSLSELEIVAEKILIAKHPEQVFGNLEGEKDPFRAALRTYRMLSLATHPDRHKEPLASEAFKRLAALWGEADDKIKAGRYGIIEEEKIVISTAKKEYEVLGSSYNFGFSKLYRCNYPERGLIQKGVLKTVRDPLDNDLLENEARILRQLTKGAGFDSFKKYYPQLVDSFTYRDPADPTTRQVNVFQKDDYDYFTAEEVRTRYPDGIDPKDAAWIWRRLLVGMGFAHKNKIINGAILPENILIQPENHGLLMGEWSYSVLNPAVSGERISALSPKFESWYPQEVFNKDEPTPALDIYLGAKNMVYLLGGDPLTGEIAKTIPSPIRSFLKGCLLPHPWQRPKDATALLKEFDQMIEGLWGPRRFHPFGMPKIASESPFR